MSPPGVSIAVGDTAHALCRALGVETLLVEREVAPGAPRLRCTLAHGRELRLVLKPGSFGEDDVLAWITHSTAARGYPDSSPSAAAAAYNTAKVTMKTRTRARICSRIARGPRPGRR
jgi:hypothetical protein